MGEGYGEQKPRTREELLEWNLKQIRQNPKLFSLNDPDEVERFAEEYARREGIPKDEKTS